MSGLKISLSTFHKRVLNLNLLHLFYLLKKEYSVYGSFVINKKTDNKIFNILKSPVQYKIARNQLVLTKYKCLIFIGLLFPLNVFNMPFKSKIIIYSIFRIFKQKLITSAVTWQVEKIFRV